MTMAGRIGVMHDGKLVQVGTPAEIYEEPKTRWVAEFIGEVNLFEGPVSSHRGDLVAIDTRAGRLVVARKDGFNDGDLASVAIRPEKIEIAREPVPGAVNMLHGNVVDIAYLGDLSVYKIRDQHGLIVKASVANKDRRASGLLQRGDEAWLTFAPDAAVLLKD
jgi:putrescine transport system ATP-binding protein